MALKTQILFRDFIIFMRYVGDLIVWCVQASWHSMAERQVCYICITL